MNRALRLPTWVSLIIVIAMGLVVQADEPAPTQSVDTRLPDNALQLLKDRCGKCHGPAEPESGLMLMTLAGVAQGGDGGAVVAPGDLAASALWQRVANDEMPPDDPLSDDERALLRRWIEAGTPGLADGSETDHWAFRHLADVTPPASDDPRVRGDIDRFVTVRLAEAGLGFNDEADRATLVRRVSFDLTGLPPSPDEVAAFLSDQGDGAYERMIERYLASPHYGERWGGHWLDTAGYADSNGYFNADTDRPLAYRYRDYVVRAYNADLPFDRFVCQQLAGDELAELAGYGPGGDVTPAVIELFEATHFLRNAPDGTDSSDGNPDEVKADKYKALEGTLQVVGSALLGLKLQCARCHAHKFEPIGHDEYYSLQAVFYPALNVDDWVKPKERVVIAAEAQRLARWEADTARIDAEIAAARQRFTDWTNEHRPPGVVVFADRFDDLAQSLSAQWSDTAPVQDDAAATAPPALGEPAVTLDAVTPDNIALDDVSLDNVAAPAAAVRDGQLAVIESGQPGDRAISTRDVFDWTPPREGDWIQVTFDLVADTVSDGGAAAQRVAYFIALVGFHDDPARGGNILVDGNPAGGASVHVRYPGAATSPLGTVGGQAYRPGHNFGVRVTNVGDAGFRLEHLVDGSTEGDSLTLAAADLPDGGFGFEYCCGRSFIVDNVVVETSDPAASNEVREQYTADLQAEQTRRDKAVSALESQPRESRPYRLGERTRRAEPPEVFRLARGDYKSPQEAVPPAAPSVLDEAENRATFTAADPPVTRTSGRRLALARWLTRPDSKAAALLARVTVNRVWQHHFGTGIVATPDNLGYSGAAPTHPELLDWLAGQFVRDGWSLKTLHRRILTSATYRQSSVPSATAARVDPDNALLWRFPLRRLDAESLRDAMLAVSGELDVRMGGSYVPTSRVSVSEVVVDEATNGAHRRSVYLQHRRTQLESVLQTFDAPSVVFNCTRRDSTTVPLQSLALLNSDFVRRRAVALSSRLARDVGDDDGARIEHAYQLALARPPRDAELAASRAFLAEHPLAYSQRDDAAAAAWVDFCQMLLASNAFIYVE
ncbi:MAG: PSD1 and planctomycete cytochrome C domain-containing protein [Pirellulales bacterium]